MDILPLRRHTTVGKRLDNRTVYERVFRHAFAQPELSVRFTPLIERECDADSNRLSNGFRSESNG